MAPQVKMTCLQTARLELIRVTPESARAAADDDRARLSNLLDCAVPADWPPQYLADAMAPFAEAIEKDPPRDGYTMWFVVRRDERLLVGTTGIKSPPLEGRVEVGYGIVASEQRRGYATEATGRLIEMAFEDPRVDRVVAETFDHLVPSIGVLLKLGFVRIATRVMGFTGDEGVDQYELKRPMHPARRRIE
jgi:ribosomal-protein-alanine N-acetyltransferase